MAPPGGHGQISVIGFVGKSALRALSGEKREANRIKSTIASNRFILLFMIGLLSG
jgi:hypothetical protein